MPPLVGGRIGRLLSAGHEADWSVLLCLGASLVRARRPPGLPPGARDLTIVSNNLGEPGRGLGQPQRVGEGHEPALVDERDETLLLDGRVALGPPVHVGHSEVLQRGAGTG